MNTREIVLLTAGGILFIFSLLMIFLLYKRSQSFKVGIWMVLISVLMMGFSSINYFELFGIVKIDMSQQIDNLKELNKALEDCPENETVKRMIKDQVDEITASNKKLDAKQTVVMSEAYLATGKIEEAFIKSQEALEKDQSNEKATAILNVVTISNYIDSIKNDNDVLRIKETLKNNNLQINKKHINLLNAKLIKKTQNIQEKVFQESKLELINALE